tara:strand:+ start:246 stop:524 length:279 start_codon:yes stop_codon:yes gene_type:complete
VNLNLQGIRILREEGVAFEKPVHAKRESIIRYHERRDGKGNTLKKKKKNQSEQKKGKEEKRRKKKYQKKIKRNYSLLELGNNVLVVHSSIVF